MDEQVAVLAFSDLHYGKETESFSPETIKKTLGRVEDQLATYQNLFNLRKLHLMLLGDLNDGSGIFPLQANEQAVNNPEEQANDVANLLTSFVINQKRIWEDIAIDCVAGNHGRLGKYADERANWDHIAYRYLQKNLKPLDLQFGLNEKGSPFFRRVKVNGHWILLHHGHAIPCGGGIPIHAANKRALMWQQGKYGPFKMMIMGHLHTLALWEHCGITMAISGSPVTGDEYIRNLGSEGSQYWWLFGIGKRNMLEWQVPIRL